jgi:di/tricarboxylate transporter
LLLAEVICRLFPDRADDRPHEVAGRRDAQPWSPAERRLLGILLLALLLWAADSLHGIAPGWVALTAALVCMLPGVNVIAPRTFETATSFGTFFYVAGLLGRVSLIDASRLASALSDKVLAWLPLTPDRPAQRFGHWSPRLA